MCAILARFYQSYLAFDSIRALKNILDFNSHKLSASGKFSSPSAFFKTLKTLGQFLLIGIIFGALAGCGSSNLGSNFNLQSKDNSSSAKIVGKMKSVGFVPLVGVPAGVSSKMLTAIKAKARARNIPVTEEIATAGYLVRGYLVASPHSNGGKLSYIWDINDSKGVRIHRVLGNEILKGGKTSNGWSLVNDAVISKVADASSVKLAGWFSDKKNRSPALNNAPLNKTPAGQGPKHISPVAKLEGTPGDPVITGAVSKAPLNLPTLVKPVKGAPGDGRISLTNALRRELSKNGIALSNKAVAGAYSVQGSVNLKKISSAQQSVNIVWRVYDSTGNRVGTVSQNKKVPAGSLNGRWGTTAVAAASAAAKGIIKLLPRKR